MKNADFAFAKAIKINNKADMYYEYIKWHEKQYTHIPDRIASFVIDKSLQLSDVAVHTRLLRLVSQNVIHSICPGLFTYYINNYNKETEKCMLILLESFRPIPKDLQLRLHLFYTQNKYFNKEIYTLLSKMLDTKYRTYFCERLLCECDTYDEEYVKQKLESILCNTIEDKHVESICIDSLMVQKDHKDQNTNNYTYVLQEKEKRILSYALQHKHLAVPKNQCLPMVKLCYSQNMEIDDGMHRYLFSNSFDLIKILSCSLDFVNYYLDNFDKYADAAYETRIAELFIVYLAKYDTNIVDTTFGRNLLANKDLSSVLDNCYDFVTKNLQNFNDVNNFTMLTIFYNILQIKYLPETKQILNNIFEVIYTQTDADKIAKYLYFINKIVELNVLSRKHLKYIYKQLVYYDNDDYRVRCYIYQILGSIVKDYSSLDTRIESILLKSDEKTHLLRTCDITEERIGLYDIQSYNKDNAKVLAAMVWFDLGCSKSNLEYPHICKLLAVIIECTGTFYERRIIRSELLNQLFIMHNQIVNDDDDDSGPFLHLLAAVNANFNLSAKDREMFANKLSNCRTSNIALEKSIQDLHLASK